MMPDDARRLHSGLYDAMGYPIPAVPAAGAPRAGTGLPRPTYAIDTDGWVLEYGPDGRLRGRRPMPSTAADVERVTKGFAGISAAGAEALRVMGDLQRVIYRDDPEQPDEYIAFPDPPPAFIYR